ncbi:MAG: site-specific DNA-methyltransferase [Actinomycetota bacterium]|nr:site-specific DNA-methyltransferase [Actinomycetota bacterium]
MARKRAAAGKQIADYRHEEATRVNNPPAGLAWQDTEKATKRKFEYDPHLDPQLVWAGKAERTSFEVEAASIHIHERLSTDDIVRSVLREPAQPALFDYEELDRSKTIDFYRHEMGWENRLILGDSLVVMTSLLEKERLGGQVQLIYIDPPYGINYNSNFQPRISSTTVRDRADDHLTREPEQVQAYRDTWTLGVHSYLTYLRDRFLVARELLSDTGSIFVQIGPDRMHLVKVLLDEIFGTENACPLITVQKTTGHDSTLLPEISDFLLWFAKSRGTVKYRQLFDDRPEVGGAYRYVQLPDGVRRPMTHEERANPSQLPEGSRVFRYDNITAQGTSRTFPIDFDGRTFRPAQNSQWKIREEGMKGLADAGRLAVVGNTLSYVRYTDDFGATRATNIWTDTVRAGFARKKQYVVETNQKIVERVLLMATDPGDLVVDPSCGSGTTADACEKLGRRWVTIDTSRVAASIARERLLTAAYPYYRLRDEARGVDAGFEYQVRTRITASSIGYAEDPPAEVLYDRPLVDNARIRVSGPFTLEALSRYAVNPSQEHVPPEPDDPEASEPQDHVQTLLEALTKQGIPRRGEEPVKVLRVEPLANIGALNAEGGFEAGDGSERTFVVSLGPRFGPVTVRQIDDALHEAYGYDLVVFAGFAATAEAQQYVAKGKVGKFDVALLEANPDLLVGDLLKATSASQTFRLFAAPDVKLNRRDGDQMSVEVLGVDLFDAATGETKFAGDEYIAAWFLDVDYDGLVFKTDQAFFPNGGWEKLTKTLKGAVDEELMEQLERFESLPFTAGEHAKAAVRVVDDAGTTSEVVLDLTDV